jgi:hypothetical protein
MQADIQAGIQMATLHMEADGYTVQYTWREMATHGDRLHMEGDGYTRMHMATHRGRWLHVEAYG